MKKNSMYFLVLIFVISSLSYATDWYVRPVGGNYGAENGTSYVNAWDGLLNVVWGPGGVQPGDTLYVCGLHVHTMTGKGNLVAQANINPISGLNNSTRITIRGDYQGDPGIVWGAYLMNYESWVNQGSNTYSITLPGDSYHGNFFEGIGSPNEGSYTLLMRKGSIAEVNSTPGSYYSPDYEGGSKLYVHCSDSGNPAGRIYGNRFGYEFILNDQSYITFTNIKFFCRRWREQYNASHIRWRNCIIWYGEDQLFEFRDGQHYMEIIGCNLAYASTIIYNISSTNDAPSYYTYLGNTIHKAGYLSYHRTNHGDRHGLGLQGGVGGIVENNEIYDCNDGIILYLYSGQNQKDLTIRYNYIHSLLTISGDIKSGINFGAPANATVGDASGNRVHHNIITGCDIGIKNKLPDEVEIFNNMVYGANDRSFQFSVTYADGRGTKTNFKNNISYNPSGYHVVIGTGASPSSNEFYIKSDHNLFYPDTDGKFLYYDGDGYIGEMNFGGWQAIARTNCIFDPNGLAGDPKFTNESGAYSNETDFQLQSNSPAIDTGTDVGLTEDYLGTSIPLGFAPDIGAFEYNLGSNPLNANIYASPTSGVIPLVVVFTGSATGGASPYSYSWNFGDGGSSTAQNPSHTYTNAGTYTVTLTVIDGDSSQAADTTIITATDQVDPLSATCAGSPTSGTAPLTVSFTGTATGGASPYSYSWNFGDGGSSTAQNPTHTYSNAGTYIAILTVSDSESNQASDSLTVTASTTAESQELLLSAVTGSPAPGSGGITDPSPGNYSYSTGETVSVQAIPNTDYRFSSWKGDIDLADIYYAEVAINMDADKSLSAYFCTRCGDANGDLILTASDAQTAFDIFLGRITNPTQCEIENADVSCNGKITPGDAQAIFNKFLKKGELPADCSGQTRNLNSVQMALQTETPPTNSIVVENSQVYAEGYVTVPIIIENPVNIDAFGFDLHFSPEILEFTALEPTELLKGFYQVDAYQLKEDELRVGGYGETPLLSESPEVLLTIVFRIKKTTPDPVILEITNTYDDLKNVVKKSGVIDIRHKGEKQNNESNEDKKIRNFSRIPNLYSY